MYTAWILVLPAHIFHQHVYVTCTCVFALFGVAVLTGF